jgi:hypothetical protein
MYLSKFEPNTIYLMIMFETGVVFNSCHAFLEQAYAVIIIDILPLTAAYTQLVLREVLVSQEDCNVTV